MAAHAEFPEFLQMVSDSGYRFFVWIRGEEKCDLVDLVDHDFGVHWPPTGSCVVCERCSAYRSCQSERR